jgi:alkylhydroperoxidase family enzyme
VNLRASHVNGCAVCLFGEAAKHYDEQALAALIVCIVAINTCNRLNVISGRTAGERIAQWAN